MAIADVLVGAGMGGMGAGEPLPLSPAGSISVSPGVDFVEVDAGGAVFVAGRATWCWDDGDAVARRLAAVQMVATGAARHVEVAACFGVDADTLRRWRRSYETNGAAALVPARRGPKGPSKLTPEVLAEIDWLRRGGSSMDEIAVSLGVSRNSVSRALASDTPAPPPPAVPAASSGGGLEPLAVPEPRHVERQAARRGELAEAAPQITEGASLPFAGALVILPALAATGLLDTIDSVFTPARAAFYGLRSLVLTLVFTALIGEPRAEGLSRVNPVDLGRLLGLDRAPEVRCLRARMASLGEQNRSGELLETLARRHVEANREAAGVFYIDGHVRAYHGAADVPKAHVARMRLSMPAEVDTWVADGRGDGVLVWQAPPGASLVGELRRAATEIRTLVGADARPTIIFDRGGWSPAVFAELDTAGFDIATYRKQPCDPEPRSSFVEHHHHDDLGRDQHYWLADRRVRLSYDQGRRRFACRQITRLDPTSGHQTQIITTRTDTDPAPLAYAMFSRWRQENFFRYMRTHYALDALDAYSTTHDDPNRSVPNPARRDADRAVRHARAQLAAAEAQEGRATLNGGRTPADTAEIAAAFADARAEIDRLVETARAIPARAPLSESHPDAARLDPERKRIHDAIRMATYNAETALARLLAPHYQRAHHEARSLLREIFTAPADLEVVDGELHVRVHPLSAPRRTRALAALCDDLTATRSTYPGTNLALTYTVNDA